MDKKNQSIKESKFSLKDAISFAKSIQTKKIKFTKKEKKQIITNLIKTLSK